MTNIPQLDKLSNLLVETVDTLRVRLFFHRLSNERYRMRCAQRWLSQSTAVCINAKERLQCGSFDEIAFYFIASGYNAGRQKVSFPVAMFVKAQARDESFTISVTNSTLLVLSEFVSPEDEGLFVEEILKKGYKAYPIKIEDNYLTRVPLETILTCIVDTATLVDVLDITQEGGDTTYG